jgi:hypothetical protein
VRKRTTPARKELLAKAAAAQARKTWRVLLLESKLAKAAAAHTKIYRELIRARADESRELARRRPTKRRA